MNNYHFAVASQSFFLNQEPLEEILRERMQYYKSCNKDIDFWFVVNPKFLSFLEKDIISFNHSHSIAAIVSLDKKFIQWLKLRVVFVHTGCFQSKSIFLPEN
uniref:Ycf54 n=1 Tax=Polysiphonia scopulorum TaxID=257860 RepID=A0A1Z1MHR4_9FLOR|nr:hypothetical protein [Polysiphonia scopulorum]ARW65506.1 hypothetical protein [Polysiphonia scopulorum]